MNKFIKYIGACLALTGLCIAGVMAQSVPSLSPALTVATNVTTGIQTNIVLLTNSAKIARIQILAGTNLVNVQVYDNNATNQTITNSAYSNRVEYVTNIATTNVSGLTGVTNIFTNSVLFETNVLQAAATNQLPFRTFPAMPSTLATYDVNMLMSKGVMIVLSTNATVVITYRNND